uniref:Multidrug and toxin extrusion protein 2-like n=1 Tax=Callorhinchus milii TaxID=7868 RepID=A0A4W3GKQ3_CALMI
MVISEANLPSGSHNRLYSHLCQTWQVNWSCSQVLLLGLPGKGVCSGVLRGAGKQKLGAIGNLIGYYSIGFPLGISLMFAKHLGITGLWIGLFICVILQSLFLLIVIFRIEWNKASEEVTVLVQKHHLGVGTSLASDRESLLLHFPNTTFLSCAV